MTTELILKPLKIIETVQANTEQVKDAGQTKGQDQVLEEQDDVHVIDVSNELVGEIKAYRRVFT